MSRRRSTPRVIAAHGDLIVERCRERDTGRLLRQGDMEASYIDLADPRHIEFDYLRRMRDAVEAVHARRIVHVGGAGCALARALAADDRDRRQLVVEIDEVVLELARAHLGLRRARGLRVRHGDGRAAVAAQADASADAIVVDAFIGARVPRHLVTAEALADAARVLAPGGVLAVNVVDSPPLEDVRAIAAGMREAFAVTAAVGAQVVLRGRRSGNVVLLAGHGPLPLERLRVLAAADPAPASLLRPNEVAALAAGAPPWRDGR